MKTWVLLAAITAVSGTETIAFSNNVLSNSGQGFATVNIPLPEIQIELRDQQGVRATGHGSVRVEAESVPASTLVGNVVEVVNGLARFTSLMFTEQVSLPVLRFKAVTSLPYSVNGFTITTGTIVLSPTLQPAYGLRFLVPPPTTVQHGAPFSVQIEAVNSAHQPDVTVTGGTVVATSTQTLTGTTSTFVSGISSFNSLAVTQYTQQPVRITFTIQNPANPRIHLETLVHELTLTVSPMHSLVFDTSGSWKAEGEVVPIRHDTVTQPPAVVRMLDSAGQLSDVEGTVTVTSNSGTGLPLQVFGGSEALSNGRATFSSLKVTTYYEGLQEAQFTFTLGTLGPLKTGLNPLTMGAFSLRFLPSNQIFNAEGTTASVTQGAALAPFTVQLLDSNGNVDATATDIQIDALLNDSSVVGTVPVVGGSASFSALNLGAVSGPVFLTFKARSLSSTLLVVSRDMKLKTGTVTVHPLGNRIAFGGFSTGSHVTQEGQTFTVNQNGVIPDIKVLLYDGSGNVDTTTSATVVVSSTVGALQSPSGGTQVQFNNGVATFTGLSFANVPTEAKLVFTLTTTGLPATGTSISTGIITVRGQPHHLERYLPYPTGAVLGVPTELQIAVVDENGTPVDSTAFSAPTLSLSGSGVTPGTWPTGMITPIRFTLGPPLITGDTARLTVTPTLAGTTFTPPTLEILLSVSNVTNEVDHASFIDPYSVPTVVKLREKQSVRVAMLDAASSPAVDGDAAYVVVSEASGPANGVVMLPYDRMVGGIQTVEFEFRGTVRDTTATFSTNLPGSTILDITRAYRLLPGPASRIEITSITNQLPVTSSNPTVAMGSTVDINYNILDLDGNKVTETHTVSGAGDSVSQVRAQPAVGGEGSVSLRFEGQVDSERKVILSISTPSIQTEQLFNVVAGKAHHISVDVPTEVVSGATVSALVTVLDEFNNLARDADTTGILVAAQQHTVQIASPASLTSPSVLTVRLALSGAPGVASVVFTPMLAGVTFSPSTVSTDITVLVLQHGIKFDEVFGPVREQGMAFTATVGEAISPPITVNVLDSAGSLDTSSSKVLIRASVAGAPEQVLANTDASVVNGRAVFSSLMFTKSTVASPQITFTAIQDPPAQAVAPLAAGKTLLTGTVALIHKAHDLKFQSTGSVFAYAGQTLSGIQYVPLGKIVVVVVDSEGAVDTTVGGDGITAIATPSQGTVTGNTVPVVMGVAVFERLAFATTPVEPVLTFRIQGLAASLSVSGKTLLTGVISILRAPRSVNVTVDSLVPSTYSPGYLVLGESNTVPVDVLNDQNTPAAIPGDMTVHASSSLAMVSSDPVQSGSRFNVHLKPFSLGTANVVFTPSASFIQFNPAALVKEYSICAGGVASVVFDENTPSELEQGTSTAITLHAVDNGGNRLSSTWSQGCREAYRSLGLAPPYATDIASTAAGTGLRMGDATSQNTNGTITVSLFAEQVLSETLATFSFNGAPSSVTDLTRSFSIVQAVPTKLGVDPAQGEVESGASIQYRVEVQSKSGQLISSADDTQVVVTGEGTRLQNQEALSGGAATFTVTVTGPPRALTITFTPTKTGITFSPSSTTTSVNVNYAPHDEGVFHTQMYQIFPNAPFASTTEFQRALAARLTTLSAGPQYCPVNEVCRELQEANVRVIPQEQWPVPPVGNATAPNNLPSARGYVVQLVNVEETQVSRIEAALANAHLPALNQFPSLQHSSEPVKFLGYNVLDTPLGVPCTSLQNETACLANRCKWDAASVACTQNCSVATTAPACSLLSACSWNKMNNICSESRDPDGGFFDDPFGQDWWILLLIGALLLMLCCACALCYRMMFNKPEERDSGKQDPVQEEPQRMHRVDSVVVVPQEDYSYPVKQNPLYVFDDTAPPQRGVSFSEPPPPPPRQLTEREKLEAALKKVDGMITYIDEKEATRYPPGRGHVERNSYTVHEPYEQASFSPQPAPSGTPDDHEPQPSQRQPEKMPRSQQYRMPEPEMRFLESPVRTASRLRVAPSNSPPPDAVSATGSALTVDGDGNVVERNKFT